MGIPNRIRSIFGNYVKKQVTSTNNSIIFDNHPVPHVNEKQVESKHLSFIHFDSEYTT